MPELTVVRVNQPLSEVLTLTCSRPHETLYDDVPLVNEKGALLGMIFSQTMVRLQNSLLQEKSKVGMRSTASLSLGEVWGDVEVAPTQPSSHSSKWLNERPHPCPLLKGEGESSAVF